MRLDPQSSPLLVFPARRDGILVLLGFLHPRRLAGKRPSSHCNSPLPPFSLTLNQGNSTSVRGLSLINFFPSFFLRSCAYRTPFFASLLCSLPPTPLRIFGPFLIGEIIHAFSLPSFFDALVEARRHDFESRRIFCGSPP